jgi:8-oxo-dGTP pyrophosphatase MutT (NUDIX family)
MDGCCSCARRRPDCGKPAGGAIEPDEAPVDAAVPEAAEETGITIAIERLRTVLGGPSFRLTHPNGDLVSYVSTLSGLRRPRTRAEPAAHMRAGDGRRRAQVKRPEPTQSPGPRAPGGAKK